MDNKETKDVADALARAYHAKAGIEQEVEAYVHDNWHNFLPSTRTYSEKIDKV